MTSSRTQMVSRAALLALAWLSTGLLEPPRHAAAAQPARGVAILQVDTERHLGTIDRRIYGQFLEHINHSVVDGLFAEQIRGAGFEGSDFDTYWTAFGRPDAARVVDSTFERGTKSVRITAGAQRAGIRQRRVFLESGRSYDGSLWIKVESGAPRLSLRVLAGDGTVLAERPLPARGSAWAEVPFAFSSARTDRDATIEIVAAGRGAALVDFVSLMRADVRKSGMLRPDLLAFTVSRRRSSAGPVDRSRRASTTRTRCGAATPTTTASGPMNSSGSRGSSAPTR